MLPRGILFNTLCKVKTKKMLRGQMQPVALIFLDLISNSDSKMRIPVRITVRTLEP